MPEVFSRTAQNLAGVIPVDAAKLMFAGAGGGVFGVGMITQNVQINYQQMINRLYEIGTNNTYFVGGRTQGQLAMTRVIGPRAVTIAFYEKYGNMCNAASNVISLYTSDGCLSNRNVLESAAGVTYSAVFCVITGLGVTLGVQDMIVNENVQMMFVTLDVN